MDFYTERCTTCFKWTCEVSGIDVCISPGLVFTLRDAWLTVGAGSLVGPLLNCLQVIRQCVQLLGMKLRAWPCWRVSHGCCAPAPVGMSIQLLGMMAWESRVWEREKVGCIEWGREISNEGHIKVLLKLYNCLRLKLSDLTRKRFFFNHIHDMKEKIAHRTWRKADFGCAVQWPRVISVSTFNASPSEVWHAGGGYCATKPGILTLVRSPWTPADTPKVTPGTQTHKHCGQGGVLQLYLSAFWVALNVSIWCSLKRRIFCVSLICLTAVISSLSKKGFIITTTQFKAFLKDFLGPLSCFISVLF